MNSVIDWRRHYDSYPYLALGAALGAGLLLGGLLAESKSHSSSEPRWRPRLTGRAPSERQQILHNWINLAAATYRVAETLYRVAPVLRDQFTAARRSGRAGLLG
jgi:hypothetical protein